MAGWLARIGVVFLVATLASALLAAWMERESAERFLELTETLLSWPVLGSGVAVAAGREFSDEIKKLLGRLATPHPS
jgi:ABC-type Fe3+ transport system permease subunit